MNPWLQSLKFAMLAVNATVESVPLKALVGTAASATSETDPGTSRDAADACGEVCGEIIVAVCSPFNVCCPLDVCNPLNTCTELDGGEFWKDALLIPATDCCETRLGADETEECNTVSAATEAVACDTNDDAIAAESMMIGVV